MQTARAPHAPISPHIRQVPVHGPALPFLAQPSCTAKHIRRHRSRGSRLGCSAVGERRLVPARHPFLLFLQIGRVGGIYTLAFALPPRV
jgi:hypothetical protein